MPLHHAGTQILKTKRLVRRPLSLDDAQAMYDNWASDPQVTRFMNWPTHAKSIEVTRTILAEWVPRSRIRPTITGASPWRVSRSEPPQS